MKRRGYLTGIRLVVMRLVVYICRLTSTLDFATARLAMGMPVSHPSISIGCEYTIEYQYNDDHVRMYKLIKYEYRTVA